MSLLADLLPYRRAAVLITERDSYALRDDLHSFYREVWEAGLDLHVFTFPCEGGMGTGGTVPGRANVHAWPDDGEGTLPLEGGEYSNSVFVITDCPLGAWDQFGNEERWREIWGANAALTVLIDNFGKHYAPTKNAEGLPEFGALVTLKGEPERSVAAKVDAIGGTKIKPTSLGKFSLRKLRSPTLHHLPVAHPRAGFSEPLPPARGLSGRGPITSDVSRALVIDYPSLRLEKSALRDKFPDVHFETITTNPRRFTWSYRGSEGVGYAHSRSDVELLRQAEAEFDAVVTGASLLHEATHLTDSAFACTLPTDSYADSLSGHDDPYLAVRSRRA